LVVLALAVVMFVEAVGEFPILFLDFVLFIGVFSNVWFREPTTALALPASSFIVNYVSILFLLLLLNA